MPLGLANAISTADISTITTLKRRKVYRLEGPAHTNATLILKFEAGNPAAAAAFRVQKKFVRHLDPANGRLRLLTTEELDAVLRKLTGSASLVAPPPPQAGLGVPQWAPAAHPALAAPRLQLSAIRQRDISFMQARHGLAGTPQQWLDELRQSIDNVRQNFGFVYKMLTLDFQDMDNITDDDHDSVRRIAFRRAFFEDPIATIQANWHRLGSIAAVDMFIGNLDRFDFTLDTESEYPSISNTGNHLLWNGMPLGLDPFDVGAATAGGAMDAPLVNIPQALELLRPNHPRVPVLAAQVFQDYSQLADVHHLANGVSQAAVNSFIAGVDAGRTFILQKLHAMETKMRGGVLQPLSVGLRERREVLLGQR